MNDTDTNPGPRPVVAITFVGTEGIGTTNIDGDAIDEGDVPDAFVPVTVKLYIDPFVRPITKIGLDVPVAIILSGNEVTV